MKTLISFLVVLVLCVAAVGFYRGWFALSGPNRDADGNRINVQLSVDPGKVKADAAHAKESASELSGQGKEQP
jgi:hypothetical protein